MESKNKAIFSLARDILRKIKKDGVKLSNVLLQAAELSHLVGIEENIKFFTEGSQKVEKSQVYLDTYSSTIDAAKDPTFSISSANPHEMLGWRIPKGNYLERQNIMQQQQNAIQTIAHYKTQTYEFVMKVYYAYLFGQEASSILDNYKKTVLNEVIKRLPELKQSFEVVNKNINSSNSREWAVIALECRNIFISLSSRLWKSVEKEYKHRSGKVIKTTGEKNKLLAYIDTKIGGSQLERARARRLSGTIHEVFAIAGKSKRKIEKSELSTIVIDTFIFLADLMTYTDLRPII